MILRGAYERAAALKSQAGTECCDGLSWDLLSSRGRGHPQVSEGPWADVEAMGMGTGKSGCSEPSSALPLHLLLESAAGRDLSR